MVKSNRVVIGVLLIFVVAVTVLVPGRVVADKQRVFPTYVRPTKVPYPTHVPWPQYQLYIPMVQR